MGEGERGHVSGEGGRVMRSEGGVGDLLQQGVQVGLYGLWGPWGPWGARWGLQSSFDVTGRARRTAGAGCLHALPTHWQLWRRVCGGWCAAPGFVCAPQRVGS